MWRIVKMGKWSKLFRITWLKRYFLGGIGVLGALLPFSDRNNASKNPAPSPALHRWISDAQQKEKRDGYSIAALSEQSSALSPFAAHRSHRSHASHYSSQGGHKSHYSHYSSYNTPQEQKKTPPKEQPKEPKEEAPKASAKETAEKTEKKNPNVLIEAKTGTVKSIISPKVFILEDSTIIELAGVKTKMSLSTKEDAQSMASAQASLTGWIKDKPVRYFILDGNKAYVFVFVNELECRCINLELLREGRLIVDDNPNIYAYKVLLMAQQEAKDKAIGVWSKR